MNICKADLEKFYAVWRGGEKAGKQFSEHLKNGTAEFWIAEENANIIGKAYFFTTLNDKDFANGTTRAYITNFYVNPDFRGQGIGTTLLENIFMKLKQTGFLEVTIGVDESESKNVRLYKKLGFLHEIKKCNIDPICVDENGDFISMNEFVLIAKYL